MNRREMLAATAASLAGWAGADAPGDTSTSRPRMGLVIHSYAVRLAADRAAGKPGLADPLTFVEHAHKLGAGGVQIGIGVRDAAYLARLRDRCAAHALYLEGIVSLPRDDGEAVRFRTELRSAREAGARLLRTVLLSGRRYETFSSLEAFREWAARARASLILGERLAAQENVRLAVENHKDWRAAELAALLRRLDSRHVGVCLDTGNNIALLDDPLEVVEILAPWAITTHFKDMGVAEYEDGFLLAEVPLGEGVLDLKRIVAVLRKARPEIHFNLEMITRDPLRVPCLKPQYWTTFEQLEGRELARALKCVRQNHSPQPLPRVSTRSREQQLALEEANVEKCLKYARGHLNL